MWQGGDPPRTLPSLCHGRGTHTCLLEVLLSCPGMLDLEGEGFWQPGSRPHGKWSPSHGGL